MRTWLTECIVLASMLATAGNVSGQAAGNIDPAQWGRPTPWYAQPAGRWTETLPLGNGRLGARVFGKLSNGRIQLNEDTLRDGCTLDTAHPEAPAALPEVRQLLIEGKNGEAIKLAGKKMTGRPQGVESYQSLGNPPLQVAHAGNVTDCRGSPNLGSGVAFTWYTIGRIRFAREVLASAPDNVIVTRSTLGHRCRVWTAICVRVAPAGTPSAMGQPAEGTRQTVGMLRWTMPPGTTACSRLCSVRI